jgi:hypothetical protein
MNSLANLVHEAQCADRMFQQTTKQYKKEVRLLQRKIGWYENMLVDYQLLVDKLHKETLHKEKKVRKWKGRCKLLTAAQSIKREKKESKEKSSLRKEQKQSIDLTDGPTLSPQMVDDVLETLAEEVLVKLDAGEVVTVVTQPDEEEVEETEEEIEVEETEEEVEVEVEETEEEVEVEVEVEETEEEVEVEVEETEEEEEVEETEEEVEVEVEETEEEVEETEEEEEVEVEVEETEEEVEVEETEEEVEVEETEEEEEEEEEVFMVTIKGKQYFTNDETNGTIYSVVDEDDIGDEVGHYKKGVPVFA